LSGAVALEAQDLRRWYGGVRAVDGAGFQVPAGQITGLIGPNGAGKSTVVSLLAGSTRPDAGRISLYGKDITRLPNWKRARLGLIRTFQVSRELPHMTVLDNVMMAVTPQPGESLWGALGGRRRWREAERSMLDRALHLLGQFGLTRMANEYAENLSGGQKRLLEMARAVMPEPKVLLLDEPVAGVNPRLINEIAGHIERMRDEGMTILMVEHELGIVERLCDSVIVMAQGRVLDVGSMERLRSNRDVVDAYLAG
jgi:ABC-type branched-subunit amino acid transport system ATPase component